MAIMYLLSFSPLFSPQQNVEYNVPGGKLNRGLTVAATLRILKGDTQLTEEEIFKANLLGWCVEWVCTNDPRSGRALCFC